MILRNVWARLSHTRALDEANGKLEIAFFESVYRMAYVTGMSTTDTNLGYLLYSGVIKLSAMLFVCCELWYLFSESSDLDIVITNINVTTIHIISIFKFKTIADHKDIFKKLSSSTSSPSFDTSTEQRAKLTQLWLKRSKIYFKVLLILATTTVAIWYVHPLLDDLEYNFMVTIRLPFDHRTPHRYPITYTILLIVFHYTSYFVIVLDLFMQAHLMHLLCQYEILNDCFENITEECGYDIVNSGNSHNWKKYIFNEEYRLRYLERLEKLIDQHKFILERTQELRKVLSAPLLGQILASGMLICFAGYQVTALVTVNVTKFFMSFLYLCYNLFQLYIICRWCDEIKLQSEKIAQSVYFSGWDCGLSQLPGVKSRLMLVMARARKPVVLTAGGLYDLSLYFYTSLVKTSYSALTLLLRLRRN